MRVSVYVCVCACAVSMCVCVCLLNDIATFLIKSNYLLVLNRLLKIPYPSFTSFDVVRHNLPVISLRLCATLFEHTCVFVRAWVRACVCVRVCVCVCVRAPSP